MCMNDETPVIDVVDLDHVAIRVQDLDAALTFYVDVLGMETRDRDRFENGDVPFVSLVAGGRHIHVVPTDELINVENEHICYLLRSKHVDSKAELVAILDQIADAGYDVLQDEPKKRFGAYGRGWAGYVRDPDGRIVELKLH